MFNERHTVVYVCVRVFAVSTMSEDAPGQVEPEKAQ